MMELCDILGINVNELLAGERIIMENCRKKRQNKNLVELQKQKRSKANKMKRKLEILWGVIAIILCPVHFSYKLFLSWKSKDIYWLVILMIGGFFVCTIFLKYYKVEIKLK